MRGHYNAHSPILEEKSRNLIESFEKQGIECHSFLSNQLKATAASIQLSLLLLQPHWVDVMEPTSHSDVISRLAGSGLGTSVSPETVSRVNELWNVHRNKEAILRSTGGKYCKRPMLQRIGTSKCTCAHWTRRSRE